MDEHCGEFVNLTNGYTDGIKVLLTANLTYADDMNCTLLLETEYSKGFVVHIKNVTTEAGYDLLHIHDGNSLMSPYLPGLKGALSGHQTVYGSYVSSGNSLTLQFTSDNFNNDQGFEVDIETYQRRDTNTNSPVTLLSISSSLHDTSTPVKPQMITQNATSLAELLKDDIIVSCDENGWDIKLDMYNLNLIYPDSKVSDIYLGDNSCKGTLRFNTLSFNQGLRECLTTETIQNDVLVYTNELICAEHDPKYPYIIRHYKWTVEVECDIKRNGSLTGHIHYDHASNAPHISGQSHYTKNMSFYLDPNFMHLVPDNPLHLTVGQMVYVKVYTTGSDWTVKMRVHSCYTKPSETLSDDRKYYLIQNGCEVDSNTHIISQSYHETRFVFEAFEYTTNHEGIQVYCDVTYCGAGDFSAQCSQTCIN